MLKHPLKTLPKPLLDGDPAVRAAYAGESRALSEAVAPAVFTGALTPEVLGWMHNLHPLARLTGMQLLARNLYRGGDAITAAEICNALFRHLTAGGLGAPPPPAEALMLMNILELLLNSAYHAGNYQALLPLCPTLIKTVDLVQNVAHHPIPNYYNILVRLHFTDILIATGDYPRAVALLRECRRFELGQPQLDELVRLETRLEVFYGRIDEFPARAREETSSPIADQDHDRIDGTLKRLAANLEAHVATIWLHRNPFEAMSRAFAMATETITLDRSKNKAVATSVASSLVTLVDYADAVGFWDDRTTAKWLRCVALKRAGQLDNFFELSNEIRFDIDQRRRGIEDPLMRGRLGNYLGYIFRSTAQSHLETEHPQLTSLLSVIESGKGKVLAESAGVLSRQRREAASFSQLLALETEELDQLRSLLKTQTVPTAYVSYLADDDCTYAVAISPDGKLTARRIPLSASFLSRQAYTLQTLNDGDLRMTKPGKLRKGIDPLRPHETSYAPVLEALAPLVDWLELDEVGLLFVNPPPEVSTIPFAMLPWRGRRLIEAAGVVNTPSTALLLHAASEGASCGRPSRATVFNIPYDAEKRGAAEANSFKRLESSLSGVLQRLTRVNGSEADLSNLTSMDLSSQIVHFSCHGCFNGKDPLKRSGLYLGADGKLPTDSRHSILSAEIAGRLSLGGSHVTLSACVSGRSMQITPGESLGMVWGLFRAQAISVIGASWNLDREAAADLLSRFYHLWLGPSAFPKWRALQVAMNEIRTLDERHSHPYFWAPYSLHGYWN